MKIIGELKVIRMVQNQHISDWSRYCSLLENCMPIVDCGVHYIDIVRWFTGSEITKVSGFGTKIDEDSPKYNYTIMSKNSSDLREESRLHLQSIEEKKLQMEI